MTRNTLNLIPIGLFFIFICACNKDEFNGSDNITTITRDLPSFEQIVANDDLDVNVIQGNTRVVEIVVNENLQDQLITKVSNNTLKISLEDGSYSNESFVINIQIPNLEKIRLNGNTRANVDYTSSELELEVNGSSTLSLQGASDVLTTKVTDDGKINGFSFTTGILNTSSSDASELEITCSNKLNGTVKDASAVQYRGMPMVNTQIFDAGEIINAN